MSEVTMLTRIMNNIKLNEDGKSGTAPDAYEQTLPEGIGMKEIMLMQKHQHDFVLAASEASGMIAIKQMASDPNISNVVISFPMGHNTGTVRTDREHKFTNNFAKSEEQKQVVVPARTRMTISTNDGKDERFKEMQKRLSDLYRSNT